MVALLIVLITLKADGITLDLPTLDASKTDAPASGTAEAGASTAETAEPDSITLQPPASDTQSTSILTFDSTKPCFDQIPAGVITALTEAFPDVAPKAEKVFCKPTSDDAPPGYYFVESKGADAATGPYNVVLQGETPKFASVSFNSKTWSADVATECADKLPEDLRTELERVLGDASLVVPRLADLEQIQIFESLRNQRDGCVAVASGDYDGDKRRDYATLMKSTALNRPSQALVALHLAKGWKLHFLTDVGLRRDFVKTVRAGSYAHTKAFEPNPLGLAEAENFSIKTDGVMVGNFGTTETVYAFVNGTWRWVVTAS